MPTDVIKIDVDFFHDTIWLNVFINKDFSHVYGRINKEYFLGKIILRQKPFIWMLHFAFSFKYLSLLILFIMLSEIKSKNVYSKVVKDKKGACRVLCLVS